MGFYARGAFGGQRLGVALVEADIGNPQRRKPLPKAVTNHRTPNASRGENEPGYSSDLIKKSNLTFTP